MWLWAMTEAVCSSLSAHTLQQHQYYTVFGQGQRQVLAG